MRVLLISLLLSLLPACLIAQAICSTPPPPADQLPRTADCRELIEDLSAISQLEDNEKVQWSREPAERPGTRQLPYRFSTPSVNNDCEILVDTLKESGGDVFSVHNVSVIAADVVNTCLEPGEGKEASIGAEVIGKTRSVAVFVLKKIALPTTQEWEASDGFNRTIWQLPLNGSDLHGELVGSLQS